MSIVARAFATVATFVAVLVTSAGPAAASTAPSTWEAHPTTFLEGLLVFVGIPVALFLVIWLFAALTARNNYVPPPSSTEVEKAPPAQH